MTAEEAPLVVETPGGLSVRYRGRSLYSDRDPARAARRAASACDPGPGRLHLVFSPLLWYGLPELLARMGPGSAALCVEADPALARLALERAPPELLRDPRVAFAAEDSAEGIALRARGLGRFRACARTDLSGGASLNAALYERTAALVAADIESTWRSRAALVAFGRLWARNLVENLAALPELSVRPFPRLRGPAIVCGAGPSLEAALPLVASRRDRLAVAACDTALGTLLAAGIEPDLVVCLEAQAHNLADFVPLGARPVRLAADLSSHPATFRATRGPKHLSLVRLAESPFLGRVAALARGLGLSLIDLPPLGSVGVHAVSLVRSLGAGPIFVTGLDFSFEVGKTHARGSPALLAEERALRRLSRWPAQYAASLRDRCGPAPCAPPPGGPGLRTDPILLSYAALLRDTGLAEGSALYDIRGRGPDIGGVPLDAAGAARLIDEAGPASIDGLGPLQAAGGRSAGAAGAGSEGRIAAGVAAFLADEAARLARLRSALRGTEPLGAEDFSALLGESDYLYWSFPDAERARGLPGDLLKRLVPEIELWLWRLERILGDGAPPGAT